MSYRANDRSPSVHFQLIQVLALYHHAGFYWREEKVSDSNIKNREVPSDSQKYRWVAIMWSLCKKLPLGV